VLIKDDIIVFFYVDDVGLAYPIARQAVVDDCDLLAKLTQKYEITGGGCSHLKCRHPSWGLRRQFLAP
jgi:hypothetical protein